jgi:hypothetical protein
MASHCGFRRGFIPDAPKKAGLVIPQLAYYDIRDVYLLGTNLWNSKTLLEMSGDYMKSTLIVDGFFAESQSQRVKDFVAAFQNVPIWQGAGHHRSHGLRQRHDGVSDHAADGHRLEAGLETGPSSIVRL